MSIDNITLPLADDLHVHLRQDGLMQKTVPETVRGGAGRVLVMPNLKPPVVTTEQALDYHNQLKSISTNLEYLMCLFLHKEQTVEEVKKAKQSGINNIKMYPAGVTTNSKYGVADVKQFYPIFEAMQDLDMIFNVHGEVSSDHTKNICILNAEQSFLPIFQQIHKDFPKLRMVLEHITTQDAVDIVKQMPENISATITVHHLDLTVDDWAGKNHNYCKPVAKYPVDKVALVEAVKSGNPKFYLGSDSAPHLKHMKETACGCAGVFTASYLMPYLADVLERNNCLERIQDFSSSFGADFYKIPRQTKQINLVKKSITVEKEIIGIVPFRAGEELSWQIAK